MNTPLQIDHERFSPFSFLARRLAMGTEAPAAKPMGIGRALLALVMIALGIRGLVFGDFAGVWQRIPIEHLPAHDFFVYATAAVELALGIGLVIPRLARFAAIALSVFLLLWVVLLKLPAVIAVPGMEATWLGAGEIVVILCGAWVTYAALANPGGGDSARHAVILARLLFVLALPTIGLSHFIYLKETMGFIPAWLPWHQAWAYLTGAASLATALAILFAVWPRLAAWLEAAMLSVITVLVWLPVLAAHPGDSGAWSAFLISSAIAAGAWAVADSYRGLGWLDT